MNPIRLSTKELIERISKALPAEIARDYYHEMLYCDSLPENDEMLRILRVLQILTVLMDGIPSRIVVEREVLERLFREAASALKTVLNSSESYQKQIDLRLLRLPGEIAEGIKPKDIARTINESLQQQFVASTIPQTAQALTVVAEQIKTVGSEFSSTASNIGDSYRGAAEQAREAIEKMSTTVINAARIARSAAEDLSVKFKSAYWKILIGVAVAALLVGFVIGASYIRNFDPPKPEVYKYYVESKCEDPPVKAKRK